MLVTHARFARRDGDPRSVADLLERRVAAVDLNPRERALLLFELGHLYDHLGAYDTAFARFQTANRLRRPAFDRAGFARLIEGLIAAGSDGVQATNRSTVPVFIVGMPRSGTSLVEQILASHPAVFGAGELNDLPRLVAEISPGYPGGLTELTAADLDRSAERHLARLASLGHGAERVTDKLPGNFLHLGIIARLFPGARIVHCLRDPLDTCLSCYFHDFGGIHPYAYDLGDLGFAYRQYECLMDHWRSTLPLPILEVRYEDLIADQEGMSRALVAFVGLDWRDECLQFHRTPRLVHTASYDQVRRPLYTSSVGRARHYYPHLGRLVEALQK